MIYAENVRIEDLTSLCLLKYTFVWRFSPYIMLFIQNTVAFSLSWIKANQPLFLTLSILFRQKILGFKINSNRI